MNNSREDDRFLYRKVREEIANIIDEKDLKPGDKLPSEPRLMDKLNVSRHTVRKALSELERDGIVSRKQGKGTFLSVPRLKQELPYLMGFTEEMKSRGYEPGSELIEYRRIRSKEIPEELSEFDLESAAKMIRLRLANDLPLGIHTVYVPEPIENEISFPASAQDNKNKSLYEEFEKAGFQIKGGQENLSARAATEFEADYLEIDKGDPLLLVKRRTFSEKDELLEYVEAVYLPNQFEYKVQLTRNKP